MCCWECLPRGSEDVDCDTASKSAAFLLVSRTLSDALLLPIAILGCRWGDDASVGDIFWGSMPLPPLCTASQPLVPWRPRPFWCSGASIENPHVLCAPSRGDGLPAALMAPSLPPDLALLLLLLLLLFEALELTSPSGCLMGICLPSAWFPVDLKSFRSPMVLSRGRGTILIF